MRHYNRDRSIMQNEWLRRLKDGWLCQTIERESEGGCAGRGEGELEVALVAHSLHGKTEFLKLRLPTAYLDETEGKPACTSHESSSMMRILLPIRDPLQPRLD
jgi:hypothetical protein